MCGHKFTRRKKSLWENQKKGGNTCKERGGKKWVEKNWEKKMEQHCGAVVGVRAGPFRFFPSRASGVGDTQFPPIKKHKIKFPVFPRSSFVSTQV